MRASQISEGRFLSANDFDDEPSSWTITSICSEVVGRGDDAAEKPVLELRDSTGNPARAGLVLNLTNLRTLASQLGDDMDVWRGATISIRATWVEYRGEQVRGIRVLPSAPAGRRKAGNGKPVGGGARAATAPLDDEIPFTTSDPDYEPYLSKQRPVA